MKLYKNKDWLRKKYLDERLSKQEIADLVGTTKSAIRWQLKKNGIAERTQSEAMMGNKHWLGLRHNKNSRKKMSIAMKGNKNSLGHKHSEKSKKIMSEKAMGRIFTEEHKKRLSENWADKFGSNNPNWEGGKSFEIYAQGFNDSLRKRIRKRDGDICQFCGSDGNGAKVQAHHIDYDRQSIDELNLICLCRKCNNRANYDRPKWQFLFETLQELRFARNR